MIFTKITAAKEIIIGRLNCKKETGNITSEINIKITDHEGSIHHLTVALMNGCEVTIDPKLAEDTRLS